MMKKIEGKLKKKDYNIKKIEEEKEEYY